MVFFLNAPFVGGGGVKSLDFERSSSQYLSISDTDFGSFDRAKFAISLWYKRESTAASMGLYSQAKGFRLEFAAAGQLTFRGLDSGGASIGELQTTATYTDTASWHHVMAHWDSANATAGDRMRLWHDGSEITSFGTDTNPSASVNNSTDIVNIGRDDSSAYYDGLLHQVAFFSGSLPAIGDVYDSGLVDITGVTGLKSLKYGNNVVADNILANAWTSNNTVTLSDDTP